RCSTPVMICPERHGTAGAGPTTIQAEPCCSGSPPRPFCASRRATPSPDAIALVLQAANLGPQVTSNDLTLLPHSSLPEPPGALRQTACRVKSARDGQPVA